MALTLASSKARLIAASGTAVSPSIQADAMESYAIGINDVLQNFTVTTPVIGIPTAGISAQGTLTALQASFETAFITSFGSSVDAFIQLDALSVLAEGIVNIITIDAVPFCQPIDSGIEVNPVILTPPTISVIFNSFKTSFGAAQDTTIQDDALLKFASGLHAGLLTVTGIVYTTRGFGNISATCTIL